VNFTHSLASWEAERKSRVNCTAPESRHPAGSKGLEQAANTGIKSLDALKIIQPEELADAVCKLVPTIRSSAARRGAPNRPPNSRTRVRPQARRIERTEIRL